MFTITESPIGMAPMQLLRSHQTHTTPFLTAPVSKDIYLVPTCISLSLETEQNTSTYKRAKQLGNGLMEKPCSAADSSLSPDYCSLPVAPFSVSEVSFKINDRFLCIKSGDFH